MSVIFSPSGATVSVEAPAAASESVALSAFTGIAGGVVRVLNDSTQTQRVAFGAGSATATTTDMPIAAGALEYVEVGPNITHAAVIETTASTGFVHFTSGQAR